MTEPSSTGNSRQTAAPAGPAGASGPAAPAAGPVGHTGPGRPGTPAPGPEATGAVWPYLLMALVVIVLDQISKYAIIGRFAYAERLPVIDGFFDLTLLYNPGAAFSFLAGHSGWQRWFFAGIAVVASVVLISLLRSQRGQPMFSTALGLMLGHVTDFLLFYQGSWAFPAFNLADCAITLGAALLILSEVLPWFGSRRKAG